MQTDQKEAKSVGGTGPGPRHEATHLRLRGFLSIKGFAPSLPGRPRRGGPPRAFVGNRGQSEPARTVRRSGPETPFRPGGAIPLATLPEIARACEGALGYREPGSRPGHETVSVPYIASVAIMSLGPQRTAQPQLNVPEMGNVTENDTTVGVPSGEAGGIGTLRW